MVGDEGFRLGGNMVNIAIVGYGFIGAIHAATLQKVEGARLVAVVEKDRNKWQTVTKGNLEVGGVEPLDVPFYETIEEMLKDQKVDCLSICLPTYLHRSFCEKVFELDLHTVCEKPMALTVEDCDAMIAGAQAHGKQLFIAQCIRFWPEYHILKRIHDSGDLGTPKSFHFQRLSGMPSWGGPESWFLQSEKSGGCLFDLHVHDIDFAHYLLGHPQAVHTRGLNLESGTNAAVISQYHYDNVMCTIEGSWLSHFGFKMKYSAVYENGQLEYDSSLSPTLKLWRNGQSDPEVIEVPQTDGYVEQYTYFVECLEQDKKPERVSPESVRYSIELALKERESIQLGRVVRL